MLAVSSGAAVSLVTGNPLAAGTTTASIPLGHVRRSTTIELAAAMADFIDNFYNVERRHSYLGNISPTEFETLWVSTYSISQRA